MGARSGCRLAYVLLRGTLTLERAVTPVGRDRELLAGPGRLPKVEAIFHQGACTDTAATDRHAVMDNNCTFSQELMRCALTAAVPFVYASSAAVYGAGSEAFTEDPTCERPINLYAQSKLAFDQHVRREIPQAQSTLVGLRYFNVYGPRESRKGKMASIVYQLYRQLEETGTVRLVTGTGGYGDGEQRRDFIHVDDVVAANLHFALGPRPRPPRQGIFNLGTGQARGHEEGRQSTWQGDRVGVGRPPGLLLTGIRWLAAGYYAPTIRAGFSVQPSYVR